MTNEITKYEQQFEEIRGIITMHRERALRENKGSGVYDSGNWRSHLSIVAISCSHLFAVFSPNS